MALSPEFRIFETAEFQKALEKFSRVRGLHKRLKHRVYPQLRQEPHFGPNIRKLRDYEPPTWRYRIGSHRIFYTIDGGEKLVFMLTIDDRKDAY